VKSITIKKIQLHIVSLPYVEPLRTSFGMEPDKAAVLVELTTDSGITGWGEAPVEIWPGYGSETILTCTHILEGCAIPLLVGQTLDSPLAVPALLKSIRGHSFARFAIEAAVWDAFARENDMRLADCFAAFLSNGHQPRSAATVGVSIGIQPSVDDTLAIIQKRLDQGYQRIKLKIKRGWDVELARGVRAALPDITLMLDANSDYTLADADHLAQLDAFNLLMIEQPLAYDDIYEHSKLQPRLRTPICLDESIKNANDLRMALEVGACKILNLKPARVGGFTESLKIYNVCVETGTPLWIGGMLETGVGRAANVAFASLPGVTLPCDISATDRYFNPDLTEPAFVLGPNSTLAVPDSPGIGVEVQRDRLEAARARWQETNPYVQRMEAS
jgi:O-succinylbenzoate synthase